MVIGWMRDVPIWVWGPLVFVSLKVAYAIGRRLGLRERARHGDEQAAASGQVTLGAMLALLGLLLAFTYSFALTRFEDRRIALLQETNAIGTAYQWADLAAEPGRTELQRRLLDYARTRSISEEVANNVEALRAAVDTSLAAQKLLWPAAKAAIGAPPYGPAEASTAASVIVVSDVGTTRLTAGAYRIPQVVLGMLLLVMGLSIMLVAFRAARLGAYSALRANGFMLVLTALFSVILDFDRSRDGFIILDDVSLRMLIADMEQDLEGR